MSKSYYISGSGESKGRPFAAKVGCTAMPTYVSLLKLTTELGFARGRLSK